MSAGVLKVAVIRTDFSHYRAPFYERLFDRRDLDVHVFCQATVRGVNLTLVHDRYPDRVTVVPVLSTHRETIAWQRLPWRRLLSDFDVIFVMGNPRLVSSILFATVASCLGRRVVLHGQAHTQGANPVTEWMRLSWWRWYRHLFVYTDREVEMLRQKGFTTHDIVGMNNGLDQRRIDAIAHEWTPERLAGWREHQGLAGRTAILSCARLEAKNRFELGIEALAILLREHPDLVWCVIGDGVQKDALTRQAEALGVSHAIRWVGAVTDDADLAPWFLNSELLLHPASIGLTLLHAFGYGLPVVTHGDPREHNPEFAAFEDGGTGRAYVGGAGNLADAVRCCLADADGRARMSARALRIARESHNVDVMAERFAELAKRAAGA